MTEEEIIHVLGELSKDEDLLSYENESRNGRLFATVFHMEARYVVERKSWFVYDGVYWQRDTGALKVMELCKKLAYAIVEFARQKANDTGDYSLYKSALKWHKRSFRETVIKDATSVFPLSIGDFDSDSSLLNFKNVTLSLKTGLSYPHNPLDFITKCMDANYNEKAQNERFIRFIDEITSGDRERAKYLQKALGYALSGNASEECMFILYGATTRNGKSTLIESVLSVLGTYACTANPETIALRQQNSASPSEDIARLRGVRFVNISEPPQAMLLNAARVKTMTGSDTLNARFLHENSFDFKPQFKMYVNTNHLPTVNDQSLFMSNRLRIIPFERHFEEHEQDKRLKEYFAESDVKDAVAIWLVEGYFKYLGEGLTPPESVKNATSNYEEASDKIKQFIDERLINKPGETTPTSEIYREYRNWCIGNGMQPLSQNRFSEKLKRYGEIKRKQINHQKVATLLDYSIL